MASPDLGSAQVTERLAGIRPYRRGGVRVEVQPLASKMLVHNFGHGGAGITLSWGTAIEAAELLEARGLMPGKAAVLGAGAVGLATAVVLLERGWEVTLYAEKFSPETTSNIAAAQFAPSLVAGIGSKKMSRWVRNSAIRFLERRGDEHGIYERPNFATGSGGSGLRHLPADLFPQAELASLPIAGCRHAGRVHQTLLIETQKYMPRMMREMYTLGGRIEARRFRTAEEIEALAEPVVVNCLGLGASRLFNDDAVVPMRGQLVKLRPQPLPYLLSFSGGYMFPRSDGVILGGTVERGVSDTQADADDCAAILDSHRVFHAIDSD